MVKRLGPTAVRAISKQYPLTKKLAALRPTKWGRPKAVKVDIVSPPLCEDVIKRLAPSLVRHRHCDIIDVNPGVGLWSSHIHDHLKPRTHILMEPEQDAYLPFLRPLLKQRNSTYRNFPHSGYEWSSYRKLMEERLLPQQSLWDESGAREYERNDSLLFIANFGVDQLLPGYTGFASMVQLMMHQLISAIRTHSIFQAYGLVRMLLWVADPEKRLLLPRSIMDRRKTTIEVELCCRDVVEIAGYDKLKNPVIRDHSIDFQSAIKVAGKIEQEAVAIPEYRKTPDQKEAEELVAQSPESLSPHKERMTRRPWHQELEDLERRFENGEFTRYHEGMSPSNPKRGRTRLIPKETEDRTPLSEITPEWNRLRNLRNIRNSYDRRQLKIVDILDLADEAGQTEKRLFSKAGLTQKKQAKADSQIEKLYDDISNRLETFADDNASKVVNNMDDRRAFSEDPPLLLWDRRPFEPLLVKEDEFFPRQPLALLDVEPKALSASLQARESYEVCEYIISHLFTQPAKPLVRVLDSLAAGASEALIPQVPALRDPLRGGRRNIKHLRVRMLTVEMLEGLVHAWEEWLFKPSRMEVLAGMTGAADDDGQERSGAGVTP
ncbi:MAG: hypothetical protein M1833_004192 [Piccolia ochrophora]|nr:MAG: hypothetical protein M1833_004192 [Piccolia ochrophora]